MSEKCRLQEGCGQSVCRFEGAEERCGYYKAHREEPAAVLEVVDLETLEAVERQSEAVALHQRILASYAAINGMIADWCKLLKDMRDRKLYRDLGCRSFDEYVEERCHIKARQAYTYISTYERLGEKRLAEHGALGITKLSYLAELYPAEVDELTQTQDLAGMSSREVKALVAKAAKQGEQLSMLETELSDAEKQEKFYKTEMSRLQEVNEKLAQQLAAAKEAARAPVLDEQAVRDAARQDANRELAERLQDAREQAERDKQAAVAAAKAEAKEETERLRQKMAAERAEHDRQLNDVTLKRKKAVEAAEKKAAKTAREEAAKAFEAEKQRAVEEARAAALAEARATAERQAAQNAAELEKLRRQMVAAVDKETVRYSVLFEQLQGTANQMKMMVEQMMRDGQTEKGTKLAMTSVKALGMLAEKFRGVTG